MNPDFPIFVPTKGRWKTPYTIRALEKRGIPYTAVVEEQEYAEYKEAIRHGQILVSPHRDKGCTVTRNWIWDYAQHELKVPFYWTMDDNIRHFYRLHQNREWHTTSGTFLRVIEDYVQRFENVYIAGMQYEMFAPRKQKKTILSLNTRIYSNMLIKTDIPYRFVTFFNEDTDLCLRILKDGFCTILFNMFLVHKIATMNVSGGNTDYYQQTNRREEFVNELIRAHPDVVKKVWRYNRWHHEVDYSGFKYNHLVPKAGASFEGINEFGMKLVVLGRDS